MKVVIDVSDQNEEVKTRRDDGKEFVIKPEIQMDSPLDVPGIDLGISTDEILACIHEGRRTFE